MDEKTTQPTASDAELKAALLLALGSTGFLGFAVTKRVSQNGQPASAPAPAGMEPTPASPAPLRRYSMEEIRAFVERQTVLGDSMAKSQASQIYRLYTEVIADLPPWQQVLLLDSPDPPTIGFGNSATVVEALNHPGQKAKGFFSPRRNLIYVDISEGVPMAKRVVRHETGHFADNRMLGEPSQDYWTDTDRGFQDALDRELALRRGRTAGSRILDIAPEYEGLGKFVGRMTGSVKIVEAKAEFTAIFNRIYAEHGSDWAATDRAMTQSYSELWPYYRDKVIPRMQELATGLNPQIDVQPLAVSPAAAPVIDEPMPVARPQPAARPGYYRGEQIQTPFTMRPSPSNPGSDVRTAQSQRNESGAARTEVMDVEPKAPADAPTIEGNLKVTRYYRPAPSNNSGIVHLEDDAGRKYVAKLGVYQSEIDNTNRAANVKLSADIDNVSVGGVVSTDASLLPEPHASFRYADPDKIMFIAPEARGIDLEQLIRTAEDPEFYPALTDRPKINPADFDRLLRAMDEFNAAGVYNGDMRNPKNIFVRNEGGRTYFDIIDWGGKSPKDPQPILAPDRKALMALRTRLEKLGLMSDAHITEPQLNATRMDDLPPRGTIIDEPSLPPRYRLETVWADGQEPIVIDDWRIGARGQLEPFKRTLTPDEAAIRGLPGTKEIRIPNEILTPPGDTAGSATLPERLMPTDTTPMIERARWFPAGNNGGFTEWGVAIDSMSPQQYEALTAELKAQKIAAMPYMASDGPAQGRMVLKVEAVDTTRLSQAGALLDKAAAVPAALTVSADTAIIRDTAWYSLPRDPANPVPLLGEQRVYAFLDSMPEERVRALALALNESNIRYDIKNITMGDRSRRVLVIDDDFGRGPGKLGQFGATIQYNAAPPAPDKSGINLGMDGQTQQPFGQPTQQVEPQGNKSGGGGSYLSDQAAMTRGQSMNWLSEALQDADSTQYTIDVSRGDTGGLRGVIKPTNADAALPSRLLEMKGYLFAQGVRVTDEIVGGKPTGNLVVESVPYGDEQFQDVLAEAQSAGMDVELDATVQKPALNERLAREKAGYVERMGKASASAEPSLSTAAGGDTKISSEPPTQSVQPQRNESGAGRGEGKVRVTGKALLDEAFADFKPVFRLGQQQGLGRVTINEGAYVFRGRDPEPRVQGQPAQAKTGAADLLIQQQQQQQQTSAPSQRNESGGGRAAAGTQAVDAPEPAFKANAGVPDTLPPVANDLLGDPGPMSITGSTTKRFDPTRKLTPRGSLALEPSGGFEGYSTKPMIDFNFNVTPAAPAITRTPLSTASPLTGAPLSYLDTPPLDGITISGGAPLRPMGEVGVAGRFGGMMRGGASVLGETAVGAVVITGGVSLVEGGIAGGKVMIDTTVDAAGQAAQGDVGGALTTMRDGVVKSSVVAATTTASSFGEATGISDALRNDNQMAIAKATSLVTMLPVAPLLAQDRIRKYADAANPEDVRRVISDVEAGRYPKEDKQLAVIAQLIAWRDKLGPNGVVHIRLLDGRPPEISEGDGTSMGEPVVGDGPVTIGYDRNVSEAIDMEVRDYLGSVEANQVAFRREHADYYVPDLIKGLPAVGFRSGDKTYDKFLAARDAAILAGEMGDDTGAMVGKIGRIPVTPSQVKARIEAAAKQYIIDGGTLEHAQALNQGLPYIITPKVLKDLQDAGLTKLLDGADGSAADGKLTSAEILAGLKKTFHATDAEMANLDYNHDGLADGREIGNQMNISIRSGRYTGPTR